MNTPTSAVGVAATEAGEGKAYDGYVQPPEPSSIPRPGLATHRRHNVGRHAPGYARWRAGILTGQWVLKSGEVGQTGRMTPEEDGEFPGQWGADPEGKAQ